MGNKIKKKRLAALILCAAVSLTSVPFPSFGTETAAAGSETYEAAGNPADTGAETAAEAGNVTDAGTKTATEAGNPEITGTAAAGQSAERKGASSVFYVSAAGSDRSGDGSREFPYASVQKAYDEVEISGQIIVSGTVVIEDYMDILRFEKDKSVRITGESGGCIIYDGDQNIDPASAVMNVSAGSVELSDITVKMPDIRGKNGRVLYVSETAEVTVGEGAVIENGYLASSSGNIFVAGGGTVTLDGGTVQNGYLAISNADAYGAGVFVGPGGTFLMKSGEITGNTARTTVSSYRTYGGGAAVMAGGTFVMTGGKISGNEAETGGGGFYIQDGAFVTLNAASSGSGLQITGNFLRKNDVKEQNNLYFAEDAAAFLSGSMAGAEVGVTCEDDYYGRVVFEPSGTNTISASDEEAFFYDGGAYDIRLDSFTAGEGNLILWHWTVGVEIVGDHITSTNTAEETPADLDYETVILPEEGYTLPEDISVQTGAEKLSEEEYVWDPETGQVLIESEQIRGDIVISVDAEGLYDISVECRNVQSDLSSASVLQRDTTQIRFSAVRKYGLPSEDGIRITGDCDAAYDEEQGILTIRNVTENISVAAEGSRISHTVTFDPNGGTLEEGEESKEFFESDPTLGTLPEPEREGYHFDGWFDPEGNRVTEDTPNDNEDDLTLRAEWSAKTDIEYTVFHYVEWVYSGVNPETENSGRIFVTMTDSSGTERVYYLYTAVTYRDGIADSMQTMNDRLMDCGEASMHTLSIDGFELADFNEYEYRIAADGSNVIRWYYNRADIAVHYDGNGGTASEAETSVKYGSCFGTLATAVRDGYTFDGWYTEAHGGTKVTADQICMETEEMTLYAHWKARGDTPYTVYHRIQNLVNNIVSEPHDLTNTTLFQTEVLCGTSDMTADLYCMAIDGFTGCPDNLYQVYIDADGTATAILYYDRLFTTVRYDANGGTMPSDADMRTKVYYEGVMGALPAQPQRQGYLFSGWYTSPEGGSRVDENTGYEILAPEGEKEVMLYAHWTEDEKEPDPEPENPPSSGGGAGGGSGGGSGTPERDEEEESLLTGEHIRYMQGYPDGTFHADGNMTRAEAAQMFFNLLNEKIAADAFYSDVKSSAWYADAVGALSRLGIVEGYEDGSFRPDDEISRAEFVAMISRFFEIDPVRECEFPDVGEKCWYYGVIASATSRGWITGYSDGTFRPQNFISRAEVAAITNRVLERSADRGFIGAAGEELTVFEDLSESHWAYYTVLEAANGHDYEQDGETENWIRLKYQTKEL